MSGMKFRKKPVEVEAIRVAEVMEKVVSVGSYHELPQWLRDALIGKNEHVRALEITLDAVIITTLEGVMRGDRDDWIIRGVRGELYPCKPDIFEATYEAVE